MNRLLFVASLLAAFTAIVRIFAGGEDVVSPLLASPIAGELKLTLYAVWHMASVALVMSGIALFIGSMPRHAYAARNLVLFVSALWCAFGVIFWSWPPSSQKTAGCSSYRSGRCCCL
jgi:hypothetical protein